MRARILVADDDPDALAGFVEFLAHAGFDSCGAATGEQAIEFALARPPAAIITDISLPGVDGFALAETIRLDPRTQAVPVLGLTGHWGPEISAMAAQVGMVAILMKPCAPAHLLAELHRVLAESVAS